MKPIFQPYLSSRQITFPPVTFQTNIEHSDFLSNRSFVENVGGRPYRFTYFEQNADPID